MQTTAGLGGATVFSGAGGGATAAGGGVDNAGPWSSSNTVNPAVRWRARRPGVKDSEPELSKFYASLFESEARHHTTYVRIAESFAERSVVRVRLDQLSADESQIIAEGSELPRMHS